MTWDFPVEGRLFIPAVVVLLLAPFFAGVFAALIDTGAPNQELDWYASLSFGAAVLLILSYIYGRTAEERADGRRSVSK